MLVTGQDYRVDVSLALANKNDTITVSANIGEIRSDSAEVSQLIDRQQLHDIPSLNRTVTKFALLDSAGSCCDWARSRLPGCKPVIDRRGFIPKYGVRVGWHHYLRLGLCRYAAAINPSRIGSGNAGFNRELSSRIRKFSTTGVIVLSTRSGTNDYHGEAFGYLRPSGLQSNPPLSSLHVPNERHDWGFLGGGPIHPGRAWFFADYERSYQKTRLANSISHRLFFQWHNPGLFRIATHRRTLRRPQRDGLALQRQSL